MGRKQSPFTPKKKKYVHMVKGQEVTLQEYEKAGEEQEKLYGTVIHEFKNMANITIIKLIDYERVYPPKPWWKIW